MASFPSLNEVRLRASRSRMQRRVESARGYSASSRSIEESERRERDQEKQNRPLPHILCISCPASKDYSTFFHKLLISAFKRNRKPATTLSSNKKKKNKKQNRFPFTFDTIVLNNASVEMSKDEFNKQISKATAIIISGSSNSANDDEPWIHYLNDTIVKSHQRNIQLVGICFGHQIIARALGGTVILNPDGDESGVCTFEATNEGLQYLSTVSTTTTTTTNKQQSLSLFCWHGDVVIELPDGCLCGGSNTNTTNQFYYNETNILCFQSHPEFNKEWVMTLATKYFKKDKASKYQMIATQVNALKDIVKQDSTFINDAIYHFCINAAAAAAATPTNIFQPSIPPTKQTLKQRKQRKQQKQQKQQKQKKQNRQSNGRPGNRRYRSFQEGLNDTTPDDEGLTNRDRIRQLIESRGHMMVG